MAPKAKKRAQQQDATTEEPKPTKTTKKITQKEAAKTEAPKTKKRAQQDDAKAEAPAAKRAKKEEKKPKPAEAVVDDDVNDSSDDEEVNEWWKDVYMVGCEWDAYDKVFEEVKWEFDNLAKAMAEDGILKTTDLIPHVFGATEPQLINLDKSHGAASNLIRSEGEKLVQVPVYIVVLSPVPLPSRVGVKSVMMAQESIKPMREYRMAWVPLEGKETVAAGHRRKKSDKDILVLKTLQRRAVLQHLNEERKCKSNYCNPYIFLPHKQKPEDPSTTINFFADVDNNSIPVEFDWEMDDFKEFVSDLAKEFSLNEEKEQELKDLIKAEVKKTKEKIKKETDAKQKELDDIPDDVKEKLKQTRIMKFYPTNTFPNIDHIKTPFVNRYFGKADEVL
eukprot:c819_g1_i1.p1 GENE.c819_g1_i1~~c819_g1_i1.p1  ORF type:complete len:391 (+),score=140.54 c819_g1_i1:91-1263(+)